MINGDSSNNHDNKLELSSMVAALPRAYEVDPSVTRTSRTPGFRGFGFRVLGL